MGIEKPAIAVYDAKPYDRDYITRASGADKLDWSFHAFRLETETVVAADGAEAVCVFVNDVLNREVLERLAGSGVRLVALRCAGFNNVDLEAAKELSIAVTCTELFAPRRGRAYYRSHSCLEPQDPSRLQPGQGNEFLAERVSRL